MLDLRPKCESIFLFLSFPATYKQGLILRREIMFNVDREIVYGNLKTKSQMGPEITISFSKPAVALTTFLFRISEVLC
jgi:hypothetical protein